jgi:hypothetical protein
VTRPRCYRLCRLACSDTARVCEGRARFPRQARPSKRERAPTKADIDRASAAAREDRITRRAFPIPEDE